MRCGWGLWLTLLASLPGAAGCVRAGFAPRGREDAAVADRSSSAIEDGSASKESGTGLDSQVCPQLPRAAITNNRLSWKSFQWLVDDYHGTQFYNDQVWVDCHDKLHLVLRYESGTWAGFNVIKSDGAKHGTFTTTVETDVGQLLNANPNLVFSIFTHDDSLEGAPWNNGELLIELTNKGNAKLDANAYWINAVAPAFIRQRSIKGPSITHVLEWVPERIKFSAEGPEHPYAEWLHEDTATIPPEQSMKFLFFLSQIDGLAPPGGATSYTAEIVLSDFRFAPR